MWTPPQRIRHALPVVRWPTAEEAAASRLFSPLTLRSGLGLRHRSWVPAMVPWRATEDGLVTDEVLEWYGRFAEGAPAVIVIEATGIRDVPSGPLLRIGHDRFVPGLSRLVERVRQRSGGQTRLFVQLIDFLRIRRRPDRARFLERFLSITDEHRARLQLPAAAEAEVRAALVALAARDEAAFEAVLSPRELEALRFGDRERVTDVEQPHVRELPRVLPALFADGAARAKDAGFDGVELHYAHAYTMASFLSARNTRADGYGGAREHRVRLPREVLAAVRDRVGAGFTVGCRMLCDEIIEGGSGVDDASYFGVELSRAGLDFLSLSTGGKFEDAKQPKVGEAAYPYTGPSGYECMPTVISDERGPFARNVGRQARVRAALREAGLDTPVVVAGGIHAFEQAEAILARGQGDLVAAARQSLADPDWFEKLRRGRGAEIRRCLYTNYCEALDQRHRAVTCQRWDREALNEPGASKTDGGRRRLTAPAWKP
ncbi:MAG: NADH:flavin oxidoreductase [Deltaproteobacteria bacterium]|nr:NADH:flavin oxidoreductase [Deltaproteobacteria bacterium]